VTCSNDCNPTSKFCFGSNSTFRELGVGFK
jgi:hypothetical protein